MNESAPNSEEERLIIQQFTKSGSLYLSESKKRFFIDSRNKISSPLITRKVLIALETEIHLSPAYKLNLHDKK